MFFEHFFLNGYKKAEVLDYFIGTLCAFTLDVCTDSLVSHFFMFDGELV